jgi:hypothetical protein
VKHGLTRLLPALIFAAALWPLGARGGEKSSFYAAGKWESGQRAATKSKLVVVAKVVEAGKPGGKGWDGNVQRAANYQDYTGEVEVKQRTELEIVQVLRGKLKEKKLVLKLGKVNLSYQLLRNHWRQHYYKRGQRAVGYKVPAGDFALLKGKSYVLFLDEPKREKKEGEKNGDGQLTVEHVGPCSPVETGNTPFCKSVKAFCKTLHAWENPPKLDAKEEARVRKLIKQLGHEQFDKRREADKALRAVAVRIRPLLAEAAKDKDIERATAAQKILDDFKPKAGKTQYPKAPSWADEKPESPRKNGGKPAPATGNG